MGLADLHIYTTFSFDGTSTVSAVLKKAVEVGLDVIAITEHDEIQGSLDALALAPAYGIAVIPACEVTTTTLFSNATSTPACSVPGWTCANCLAMLDFDRFFLVYSGIQTLAFLRK
jgi:DNA polymerase III alpha subunit